MASITIRKLPETTKRKLRIRAARNGRSMEQEAREISKPGWPKPTPSQSISARPSVVALHLWAALI